MKKKKKYKKKLLCKELNISFLKIKETQNTSSLFLLFIGQEFLGKSFYWILTKHSIYKKNK